MAKKKLFGNRKEPRCETCAHGKLTADKTTVLCQRGGALPLSHSCRRYQYDPLRRTPKRRPLLGEYSAADFALDAYQDETLKTTPAPESVPAVSEHQTLDKVFAYLNSHDTPDVNTILEILNKSNSELDENAVADDVTPEAETDVVDEPAPEAEADVVDEPAPEAEADVADEPAPEAEADVADEAAPEAETDVADESAPETEADVVDEPAPEAEADVVDEPAPEAEADVADEPAPEAEADIVDEPALEAEADVADEAAPMQPDDSPDIFGDLNRMTAADTDRFAFGFADLHAEHERDMLLLQHYPVEDILLVAESGSDVNDAPLHIQDLVILSADELADD